MNMPMPVGDTLALLSWGRAFATWRFAPVTTLLLVLALMVVERALYLGGGYLYFSRLLTADSPYRPLAYPLRLFSLFMGMSADTVVGVVLLQATHPPFPAYARMHPSWGPGPLTDIHDGGAVMWIGGDGLMFVMMLVVGLMWFLDRSPEARRAGAFLESARQSALARTGHESPGGESDRDRLRASGDAPRHRW